MEVLSIASIAMNGKRQFDGHTQSCGVRNKGRTASQIVGHIGTHVDVVGIIVSTLATTIDGVGHTSPLGIVTGSLNSTRHTAD